MEWSKEAAVLLALDGIEWAYLAYARRPECMVDVCAQEAHEGKKVVVTARNTYAVACERHIGMYLKFGWKIYEG